jgi:hypothetical protein
LEGTQEKLNHESAKLCKIVILVRFSDFVRI